MKKKEIIGMNEEQTRNILNELDKRGKQNISLGNILIIFSLVQGGTLFFLDKRISFSAIAIFAAGVWIVQLGKNQRKQN